MSMSMSTALAEFIDFTMPKDPSGLGYPPMFLVELALRNNTVKEVCEAYDIDAAKWNVIRQDPSFINALAEIDRTLKKEGMAFKTKARLQADGLLKRSWEIIHDKTGNVPAMAQVKLIELTYRVAGYDVTAQAGGGGIGASLHIEINI